jgi:two-component system sensor histidine kinase/response regulator
MAGDEVAARIRARADWRQPKLVLASSMGLSSSTDFAASSRPDAFLIKPVRHQVLINCLAGLLGSAPAAKPTEAADKPEPEQDKKPANVPWQDCRRVLLAEDNEINILLAKTLLEGAGYHVECAVNGAEAVRAATERRFDLILMDMQMPVLDGLQATRQIRALAGEAGSPPIVAMTANAMQSAWEACRDAGMDGYVTKPIELEAFLTMVATFAPMNESSLDEDNESLFTQRLTGTAPR